MVGEVWIKEKEKFCGGEGLSVKSRKETFLDGFYTKEVKIQIKVGTERNCSQ